jgi:hypothetical protein
MRKFSQLWHPWRQVYAINFMNIWIWWYVCLHSCFILLILFLMMMDWWEGKKGSYGFNSSLEKKHFHYARLVWTLGKLLLLSWIPFNFLCISHLMCSLQVRIMRYQWGQCLLRQRFNSFTWFVNLLFMHCNLFMWFQFLFWIL